MTGEDSLAAYENVRWHPSHEGRPVLHLDDVSGIPFLDNVPGMEAYQHRARVRCNDGDYFAALTAPAAGYETYCREHLDLGTPTFIQAEPYDPMIAVAEACSRGTAFEALCEAAAGAGGLVIHPYMGIESVWSLAQRVNGRSGAPVSVLAPPPPVTWLANDKLRFKELVRSTLGDEFVLPGFAGSDRFALARAAAQLSNEHEFLVFKRLRCASAMGNRVMSTAGQSGAAEAYWLQRVEDFCSETECAAEEVVLVEPWVNATDSPSTQMWIPPAGCGAVTLDGVYDQLLEGDDQVFLGSRPSKLPRPVQDALSRAARTVARALQNRGYVGRCSFDFLVADRERPAPGIIFTECNGRWGGTSTPMFLVDRLCSNGRPAYRAQDLIDPRLRGVDLPEILRRVGDEVFEKSRQSGRYIFYNVGPLEHSGKLDVIALGEDADKAFEEDLPALLFGARRQGSS
jgi:hypothetical protein